MNNLPKISIITPSYNQDHCIEACILSVINQDYPNIEFIIIDGKSTDNSVEIIKKYADQITYWVSESDKGIYDAMNKGIEKATGDWIFFLGTDDKLYPHVISKVFHKSFPHQYYDFIYGQVKFVPSNILYGKEYTKADLVETNICHQSVFARKKIVEKLGCFQTKYPIFADYVFTMKLFSQPEIRKLYLPYCIAEYNELGASHYQADSNFAMDRYDLVKKYLDIDSPKYKFNYKVLGEEGFMLLKDKEYRKGLTKVYIAMKNTSRIAFYIKNTLYWLKKSLS